MSLGNNTHWMRYAGGIRTISLIVPIATKWDAWKAVDVAMLSLQIGRGDSN